MGKARMMGAFAPYAPNSKADMRYRRKQFERQKQIADKFADNATSKRERRELKELERMKMEAMYG